MDPNLFIAVLVAAGVGLVFIGLDLIISSRQIALQDRLDVYRPLNAGGEETEGEGDGSKRALAAASGNSLMRDLARAGLPVTPGEFMSATFLLAVFGGVLGYALSRQVLVFLIGALFGLIIPRFYLHYLQAKRAQAFNSQLESMITLLSNTLRAGFGLGQAIETIARESTPPLSVEFERVVREMALGISTRDALANLLVRNPGDDLDLIITAINVNHEVGGNLTEVLDKIASTIRDRIRLAAEVRSITAMQRVSAQVLIGLPFALVAVLYFMNPDYIGLLWKHTCGFAMLGAWGLLTILGILVIRQLLKFKY